MLSYDLTAPEAQRVTVTVTPKDSSGDPVLADIEWDEPRPLFVETIADGGRTLVFRSGTTAGSYQFVGRYVGEPTPAIGINVTVTPGPVDESKSTVTHTTEPML